MTIQRTFDRVYKEDWRSLDYRTPLTTEQTRALRSYTWKCDTLLDQGREGACVGHGFAHEIAARPAVRPADSKLAHFIYKEAQKIDYWEGEDYEGTSVLAGAKVYTGMRYANEYRWCLDMNDLVATVGYLGPVVVGVNWYEGMYDTDEKGYVHVDGELGGGHCLLARGVKLVFLDKTKPKNIDNVDFDKSSFLLHNSWGPGWGVNGTCRISLADMEILMDEQGDFCIPTKRL